MQPNERDALSPSLAGAGAKVGPAFELKFLLPETQVPQVREWAERHMLLDPHGDPALGGAYQTCSLYLDTPNFDVYYRSAGYKRRKFRLRRYGESPTLFLERKKKAGDRVAKRRVLVSHDEVEHLGRAVSLTDWAGHWFHRGILARQLQPAALIAYQRLAFMAPDAESCLRLTLDQHIRGSLTDDWRIGAFSGVPILESQVIVELKFHSALPAVFRDLVQGMGLQPAKVSKYRLCRNACGGAAGADDVAPPVPARRIAHA